MVLIRQKIKLLKPANRLFRFVDILDYGHIKKEETIPRNNDS